MAPWLQTGITILVAMIASTGFWSLVQWKVNKKANDNDLLLGLAHDRILSLCNEYIDRGNITQSEYENLNKYLYKPYIARGGNGLVKHMMEQVNKLPVIAG